MADFFLVAGPCVVESEDMCFLIAERLKTICASLNIPFVFKASYKKANRTSSTSFSTIGEDKAMQILADIKSKLAVEILTDIHETIDCNKVKDIVDVIQIPAFLCRQTELLIAAGDTGKIINIKKGQFADANTMIAAAEKVKSTGNDKVWITERGNMFGYHDLIVDFRNIALLVSQKMITILDITHSVQQPNSSTGITLGQTQYIETLAKCGIVTGVNGIFLETHPEPENAQSDKHTMLALDKVEELLKTLKNIIV